MADPIMVCHRCNIRLATHEKKIIRNDMIYHEECAQTPTDRLREMLKKYHPIVPVRLVQPKGIRRDFDEEC